MSGGSRARLPHDIGLLITILIISSAVVGSVTWVSLTPRPVEQFFALGILGADMMAEHYYPDSKPIIAPGDSVRWHVTVYNHMGSVQYVAIRAKLLNQTIPAPDSMNNTPSGAPYFEEIRRVLVDNETWTFPFYWSIENISRAGGSIRVDALELNNVTISEGLSATALHGFNFRVVLELWTYSNETAGFQYGWESGGEARSAWVQIWFNLTAPAIVKAQTAGGMVEISGSPDIRADPSAFEVAINTVQIRVHLGQHFRWA